MLTRNSVRERDTDRRDQTYHYGQRDHEVSLSHILNEHVLMAYREDDSKWPQRNKDGRQELEIRLGNHHINFEVPYFELSLIVGNPWLMRGHFR